MERRALSPELLDSRHLRIGFLASHHGSSMQAVLGAIQEGQLNATPAIVISNNSREMAMKIAETLNIPRKHISALTNPDDWEEEVSKTLLEHEVDIVVCSGWMKVFEKPIVPETFKDRIINIHPSVHEEYMGSQWMDMAIHEAIIHDRDDPEKRRTHTGYTIHKLTQELDRGETLVTGFVRVSKLDTPVSLQLKVKEAEGKGIVGLLQDLSNPHKEELHITTNNQVEVIDFPKMVNLNSTSLKSKFSLNF